MRCQCFKPTLDEEEAVDRTDNLSAKTIALSIVKSTLGLENKMPNPTISMRYYPDYIAYTTVTLQNVLRNNTDKKFIAAVDAVTGRVGEVDVTLPDIHTKNIDEKKIIPIEYDIDSAKNQWNEWLFPYINRTYRPIKQPKTSLDNLDLVYTPYYIIDYGANENCYIISTLTKQAELLEDLPPIESTYNRRTV